MGVQGTSTKVYELGTQDHKPVASMDNESLAAVRPRLMGIDIAAMAILTGMTLEMMHGSGYVPTTLFSDKNHDQSGALIHTHAASVIEPVPMWA